MIIKDLLNEKSCRVTSIEADRSVAQALELMRDSGSGALIVMDGGQPAGIFAERDLLRCHLEHRDRAYDEISVSEAMTSRLIVATPDENLRQALAMMITADIRHLPVIQDKRIVGMLTVNMLVKHQVDTLTAELHYLQDYISDLHDAELD